MTKVRKHQQYFYLARLPVLNPYLCILPLFSHNQKSYPGTDLVYSSHMNLKDNGTPYS